MAYVVCAIWTTREGEEENVARALEKLAAPSRQEPGNLVYLLHRDPTNRRVFFAYEQYVDESDYEAHLTSPHFKQHGEDAVRRLESRERSFYETWDV